MRNLVLQRALDSIAAHRDFRGWEGAIEVLTSGEHIARFWLGVEMPPGWVKDGQSPTGVQPVELISAKFPATFPAEVPQFELRADFPRNLPHLLPMHAGENPRPCLVLGSVENLFRQRGVAAMLEQLYVWLFRAANDRLNDDPASWEPARRDTVQHRVLANESAIHALQGSRNPLTYFNAVYATWKNAQGVHHQIEVLDTTTTLGTSTWEKMRQKNLPDGWHCGDTICVVLNHEKNADGSQFMASTYLPDDVVDIESLRRSAQAWHCEPALNSFLGALNGHVKRISRSASSKAFPVLLLFNVRRPRPLAGSTSHIETMGYVIEVQGQRGDLIRADTPVRPAGVLERLSPELLRRFNQQDSNAPTRKWSLVGCGSLGSKIALHMARSGRAPGFLVDHAVMGAHNFARHACLPGHERIIDYFPRPKSCALREALESLGPRPEISVEPLEAVLQRATDVRKIVANSEFLLVNTTASVAVRNALADWNGEVRVAEGALLSRGRVGYFGIEGSDRNPNLDELWTRFLWRQSQNPKLAGMVFSEEAQLEAIRLGTGCGTETMAVSDATISLQASGMSTELARCHEQGLEQNVGVLLRSDLKEDGLSVEWHREAVEPFWRVVLESSDGMQWQLHLSEHAHQKIQADIARYPGDETGGVLWGYVNDAIGAIYVLDVVEAPPDSSRSPTRFDLGIEGLAKLLDEMRRPSGGRFTCVGTWHNHLADVGPSGTDRQTAEKIAQGSPSTNALLISTPSSYCGLLAEPPKV
ncbi:Molybdopterin or thiamine biosynthesis adenylyltransferase [Solimonas aquatica]|uniref:Molybdopterin or thiamine biosynthesis adenylyltransferase n=1 Tax=Solimonas aquatica TaxID=489703 RepID=A0A1H9A657_9GAMM|nr:Mov34/MPN/PAD-1 family protein [Solimonas aquatica]SEP72180.1 Molybdopterin or thiamine biosynthesis adenylyltransferase [Solimonas aquatica]